MVRRRGADDGGGRWRGSGGCNFFPPLRHLPPVRVCDALSTLAVRQAATRRLGTAFGALPSLPYGFTLSRIHLSRIHSVAGSIPAGRLCPESLENQATAGLKPNLIFLPPTPICSTRLQSQNPQVMAQGIRWVKQVMPVCPWWHRRPGAQHHASLTNSPKPYPAFLSALRQPISE